MNRSHLRLGLAFTALLLVGHSSADDHLPSVIQAAISRAGDNQQEIKKALDLVPAAEREGMLFLVAHMPQRDLEKLSAEYLLENVRFAYLAWRQSPWKDKLPKDIFLNYVLPYANINERRDNWRADFHKRFAGLIRDAKSPAEAGAILNNKIYSQLNVRYSTQRKRADQSPYESIKNGTASCTGLSVLLVDACRAVGIPARFVGTPLWTNKSGNHSWVEIWGDGQWHFTGAAEPTGDKLDRAWFSGRAATAQRDHPLHAIYAVSFKRTPQTFPLVWDPRIDYVFAVNVTERYAQCTSRLPQGKVSALFRVFERPEGDRCAASITVRQSGNVVFQGKSKDERFDANDHLMAALPENSQLDIELRWNDRKISKSIETGQSEQLFSFHMDESSRDRKTKDPRELVDAARIPRYVAHHTSASLKIDGHLDEPCWSSAPQTTSFVDLVSGDKTIHDTRAAILWDDQYLYVAFWVEEPMVNAKFKKRDDPIYYDHDVEVFIAGQDAYYEFEINPLGTIYEGFFIWEDVYETGGYSKVPGFRRSDTGVQAFDGVGFKGHSRGKRIGCIGWDFPGLKSAVAIQGTLNKNDDRDRGWTVELAFPWKEMKWLAHGDQRALPPHDGDVWRIDLMRFNPYKESPPAKDSGGWAWGKHAVWDSHVPEIFPFVTFSKATATRPIAPQQWQSPSREVR